MDDRLGGHDPCSASKAATALAVASYGASVFTCPIVTARGGNGVGGGDFAPERLVPDLVRAAMAGRVLTLRNPGSTRPWQHVLDGLSGYFSYAEALMAGRTLPRTLNFGPPADGKPLSVAAVGGRCRWPLSVAEVAARLQQAIGLRPDWQPDPDPGPPEMANLSINPDLAASALGWRQRLDADATTQWIADWYGAYRSQRDMAAVTDAQIARYEMLPA